MAKARAIPRLRAEEPYASAAAKVVSVRARELADHSQGVLDVSDIERLHDMRVASRRLRAALEIFEPCFPRKSYRRALRHVKELADALGQRRDRDVTIQELEGFAETLPASDRAGVADLVSEIGAEQAQANAALAPHLDTERLGALGERLSELVVEAQHTAAGR